MLFKEQKPLNGSLEVEDPVTGHPSSSGCVHLPEVDSGLAASPHCAVGHPRGDGLGQPCLATPPKWENFQFRCALGETSRSMMTEFRTPQPSSRSEGSRNPACCETCFTQHA